jgi:hypothetical protein
MLKTVDGVAAGERQMKAKRFSVVLASLLTVAVVSTFGAVVSLTPVGAAIPPAAPVGVNALTNPLLATAVSGVPTCWTPNSYGSNTPKFAWTATGGENGGAQESLTVTKYSSGTADLIPTLDNGTCAPTVTPGDTYTVSAYYDSSVPVYFTYYTRSTSGTWSYSTQSPNFGPTASWTLATWTTPAVPAGVNGASFGMTLQANGSLSTSDYSLVNDGVGGVPPAAPIGVNALSNPLLKSPVSGVPTCWTPNSYGSNTPTFLYSPTGGEASGADESLTVANYSSGTANLVTTLDNGTCSPTATPGDNYTVSAYFTSTAPSYFTIYTRSTNGTWSYWTQSPLIGAPSTVWNLTTYTTPPIPAGVNGIGFGLTLQSNGGVGVSDLSLVNDGPAGVPPAGGPLINPQLKLTAGGVPTCFTPNSYGSNTAAFSWSVGEETLTVTNYSSGTANLITTLDNGTCAPTVTPGNTYTVGASYSSSAPVYFTIYTRSTNGTWSYWTQSPTFAATAGTALNGATWTTPPIPAGVNGIGFGLTLQSNGSLTTTNYRFVGA